MNVSFFGGIGFPVIDRPDRPDPRAIVIASLRHLAGTKTNVINERVALKDYLDIVALLDAGMTLPQIVAAAVAIFPGQVDYISTMSAITYFEESDAKSFPEPLKKKLRAAARTPHPYPRPRRPSRRSWTPQRRSAGSERPGVRRVTRCGTERRQPGCTPSAGAVRIGRPRRRTSRSISAARGTPARFTPREGEMNSTPTTEPSAA